MNTIKYINNIEPLVFSEVLKGKKIFLSASFPKKDRDQKFYESANPFNITDAVVALARAVFSRSGKIVFGGHPTISPLMLSVAKNFFSYYKEDEDIPMVYIYQSKIFENIIPDNTEELKKEGIGEMKWTKAVNNDRNESLTEMRTRMIMDEDVICGIFIGGMEGIKEELDICINKGIPVYCLGSTGGNSQILGENILSGEIKIPFKYKEVTAEELLNSKQYPYIISKILSDAIKVKKNYA